MKFPPVRRVPLASVQIVGAGAREKFLVVDKLGFTELTSGAVAKGPFTPVAILGPHLAVDVGTPVYVRMVLAGTVDREEVPKGNIPRFEFEMDERLTIKP